jgi:ADP-ribose pyrophosphatase YjhB (NUDIX family)
MSIFNIRVYGLLVNEKNEVLVTDEFRMGTEITKFPGGGLIWGEGIVDCLKREFREELGCEIEVQNHFYTTDYFQQSAFHKDHQVISIYYLVNAPVENGPLFKEKHEKHHPFREGKSEGAQSFRWIRLSEINEIEFTLPIDKKVAGMLRTTSQNRDR